VGKLRKQISLDDIYAVIQDVKVDIQNNYQMIEEKVEAVEKNLQEKLANLESKMMEKMREKVKNECDMKSKIETDLNDSINFMEEHAINNEQRKRKS